MLEHIREHDANRCYIGLRTWMGMWKHGDKWQCAEDITSQRRTCKKIGQAIAVSQVMKMKPLVPLAIAQVLVDTVPNLMQQLELLRALVGGDKAPYPDFASALYRDDKRFDNHYWESVPWARETWFLESPLRLMHSLHVPREDANKEAGGVAFAESPQKMVSDRFTVMKAGRYLTRFFSGKLTEKDIKGWADLYVQRYAPVEVKFARDDNPDEMIRVVAEGPRESCMSNRYHSSNDWFRGHVHPAAVYVTPDIEIAYAEAEGEVVARVICNRINKQAARIYGDGRRLLPALQALGYTQVEHALVGCRIRKISNEDGDGYIMAYVDAGVGSGGGNLFYDPLDSKYWKLTLSGTFNTYEGYDQNGIAQWEPQMTCDDCDDAMNGDDAVYIERHDRHVCQDCADNNYEMAIGRRGHESYYRTEDCIRCETNDEWYAEDYAAENEVYQCQVTGDWYKDEDMVTTSRGMVFTDKAVELAVEDSDGNSWAVEGDTVTTHDGRVIHKDVAVAKTVWFHDDDDIDNEITPPTAQQRAA